MVRIKPRRIRGPLLTSALVILDTSLEGVAEANGSTLVIRLFFAIGLVRVEAEGSP